MSKKVNILDEQNIIDLAIQETGSAAGIFDIIAQNEDVQNVDHVFRFGDEILIDPETPQDKNVRDFFVSSGIIPTGGEELRIGDFNDDFNNDFDI